MALIACPKCNSEDINGTPQADSRLLIHCEDCGHEWLRGEARRDPSRPAVRTIDSLHAEFPTPLDVRPDVRERVATLVADFQLNHPAPDPAVTAYRERYQEMFRRERLATVLDPGPHRGHGIVDEQTEIVEDLRHPRQPHPARHAEQHA